jgi:NADH-quinone oxidoreductase subunit K
MFEVGIFHFLFLAALIFIIGICGIFLNRKNVIVILMSIELMLLSININFVVFSVYLQDLVGQIFSIFILTVTAAEVSIGLAILVVFFRNKNSIAIEDINTLKG